MAVDVGSAVGYLDLDISGFLAGLKSAQSEADKTSKSITAKVGSNISGIGKNLTSVGTTLTKNVTVPILGIGAAGLKTATDFEKGMSEVKAISGATGKEFDALKAKAVELGADTAFSANEVAAAMTEMAKAGWTSQQIIDGMGGVLAAAAASGEGLATVSTIVADAVTGFGLAAKDSTRVADLLTQAANSGTIGITDLGESFKYIAPVAGAMGLSIEDITTAISAMSMAGIKGSQAGTSLRTMLTNLVNPSESAAIVMEKLKISATNTDGSMKSLDEIVANLRNSFDGLTEAEKAKNAAILAGKTGMSGMLALLNLTEKEYNAIAESMDNAGGVAEETAAIMQDNLKSKVEQLGGALESLAIKMADYVLPYLQQFVIWLTTLVDKFTALDPETQKAILKFGLIAAAIGPCVLLVGKLVTGIGGMFTALSKLPKAISKTKSGFKILTTGLKNVGEGFTAAKAGFGGLATQAGGLGTKMGVAAAGITGPMIAITAVIALVIAAFVSLWKNNEEFRNNIIKIWDQVKATFEKLTSGIVERLNKLGFDFSNISEVLKAIWKSFCDFLAPVFEGVFKNVAIIFEFIVNTILNTLDFFIALFKGDWEGCWNAIKAQFENIWNTLKDWFFNILNTIKGVFDVVLGWFGTTWEQTWNSIKEFFINTWTNISTWFKNLWDGIISFVSAAWETIKNAIQVGIMFIAELFKAAFLIITLPFRFIWENCKEYVFVAWDAIKTFISNSLNSIKQTISNVWNAIKAFLEPILNSIKTFVTNVWNGIKSVISSVVNGIKDAVTTKFNEVKTNVTNAWNAIKTGATNTWNSIKAAITGPIESAKNFVKTTADNIKSSISTAFDSAKKSVTDKFNSIKDSIKNAMDGAKKTVSDAIDNIKKKFNFSWSLPKLKLPHPKITGEFSLNPPSVPSFSIEWYKKAMNGGMILNSPTIFGYDSKSGNFLGAGEAGSETIVGTNSLMKMIKDSVLSSLVPISSIIYELAKTTRDLGYVAYNGFERQNKVLEKVVTSKGDNNPGGGGDTFVFHSPKAIDEIEAARQMKKAKRELAEGY